MLISRQDADAKPRSRRRWLLLLAILLLVPPAAWTLVVMVSLFRPVKQWRFTRTYRLPPSATAPPHGISGSSGGVGAWTEQSLRVGDWVLEWRWRSRH